jgi:hypothetical protein
MKNNALDFLKSKSSTFLVFIVASFSMLYISNEDVFQTFIPRRVVFHNEIKLISVFFISDLVMSIAFLWMGYALYKIYFAFRGLHLPWKGFLWMFGGFIFLSGIMHVVNIINLWVAFSWIDGIVRLITAIYTGGVALTFYSDFNDIKNMRADFKLMAEKLINIIREAEGKLNELKNHNVN